MTAAGVPGFALAEYQKTLRTVLRYPLITSRKPDEKTLPLVRRWADELRADLADQFGYQLEFIGQTARLLRARDQLDDTQPAVVRDRSLDRQRYAYVALALGVLGRAGIQITLGELAESVAADAGRIDGLGLDTDRYGDRRAFVDAVTWLEERGALAVADGSPSSWASDPERAEALYDIDRDVLIALFRPSRVLQHVDSVTKLLHHDAGSSGNIQRQSAAQRARRLLVEHPVVYFADVEPAVRNQLRSPALAADLERLTGLRIERRAEGVLLVDTAGLTDARFPGSGAVAQAALLLLGETADRIVDPDARKLPRLAAPEPQQRQLALAAAVDSGLPAAGVLAEASAEAAGTEPEETGDELEPERFPLLSEHFLRTRMKALVDRYGAAFGETWRADPDRLRELAIDLLQRYGLMLRTDGGVLVLPLAGRYRNVQATVRKRRTAPPTLFESGGS